MAISHRIMVLTAIFGIMDTDIPNHLCFKTDPSTPRTKTNGWMKQSRTKKQDIARELGVSRTTLWRMERMAKEKNEKNQPL